ncbi:MAG TPA: hypothetical protein VLT47_01295 [Anaeromyxobacteraceae bacterium]|nr:hypothetical protein [Anaeromyxobacteraceae bacterium]
MRKLFLAAALAVLLPVAATAQANLGVKLGLAWPGGDKFRNYPMSTETGMAVPVELSLGFALSQQLDVGVYGGYAFVQPDSTYADYCDLNGGSCDEHLWRLGVKTEYAFAGQGITPFVGANFGFEWDVLDESVPAAGYDFTDTLRGWELGFQVGADAWVGQMSKVGAFVGLAFGEYTWEKIDGTYNYAPVGGSGSISDRAGHSWFTVGVRGAFGL